MVAITAYGNRLPATARLLKGGGISPLPMQPIVRQRLRRQSKGRISMKSTVKFAAVVTVGLMVGAVVAPGFADDKPTLAFVVNGASDFWKAAEAGMKKAQGELPGYN